jgi:hypothetical protein
MTEMYYIYRGGELLAIRYSALAYDLLLLLLTSLILAGYDAEEARGYQKFRRMGFASERRGLP